MSVIGILDRIIQRKKQATLSAADSYLSLVRSVANGDERDADEAAEIIDHAGKDASQFERDVSTMVERFALAERLRKRVEVERELPELQKKLEEAQRAYADAVQRLQPAITVAFTALQDAENQMLSSSNLEAKLSETCLDESLLSRERELLAQRMEVMQKRNPLVQDLDYAKQYLRTCSSTVESLVRAKKNESHPDHQDLRHWRRELNSQQPIVDQLSRAVSELDAELTPITNELFQISKEKLTP